MSYTITAPSATEPITLDEVKMHLRVDGNLEDSALSTYLSAARSHCERFTGLSFVEQGITLVKRRNDPVDEMIPYDPQKVNIELPLSPVVAVISVKDGDGNDLTHEVDIDSVPAVLTLDEMPTKLVVVYETGASQFLPDIKMAILMLTHLMYQHRGDMPKEAVERVEEAFLRTHRVALGMA